MPQDFLDARAGWGIGDSGSVVPSEGTSPIESPRNVACIALPVPQIALHDTEKQQWRCGVEGEVGSPAAEARPELHSEDGSQSDSPSEAHQQLLDELREVDMERAKTRDELDHVKEQLRLQESRCEKLSKELQQVENSNSALKKIRSLETEIEAMRFYEASKEKELAGLKKTNKELEAAAEALQQRVAKAEQELAASRISEQGAWDEVAWIQGRMQKMGVAMITPSSRASSLSPASPGTAARPPVIEPHRSVSPPGRSPKQCPTSAPHMSLSRSFTPVLRQLAIAIGVADTELDGDEAQLKSAVLHRIDHVIASEQRAVVLDKQVSEVLRERREAQQRAARVDQENERLHERIRSLEADVARAHKEDEAARAAQEKRVALQKLAYAEEQVVVLNEECAELREDLAQAREGEMRAREEVGQLREEAEAKGRQVVELEARCTRWENDYVKLVQDESAHQEVEEKLRVYEGEIEALREQVRDLEAAQEDFVQLAEKQRDYEERLVVKEEECCMALDEIETLREKLTEAEEAVSEVATLQRHNTELEERLAECQVLVHEAEADREQAARLQADLEAATARWVQLENELETLGEEVLQMREANKALEDEVATLRERKAVLEKTLHAKHSEIQQFVDELRECGEEVKKLHIDRDRLVKTAEELDEAETTRATMAILRREAYVLRRELKAATECSRTQEEHKLEYRNKLERAEAALKAVQQQYETSQKALLSESSRSHTASRALEELTVAYNDEKQRHTALAKATSLEIGALRRRCAALMAEKTPQMAEGVVRKDAMALVKVSSSTVRCSSYSTEVPPPYSTGQTSHPLSPTRTQVAPSPSPAPVAMPTLRAPLLGRGSSEQSGTMKESLATGYTGSLSPSLRFLRPPAWASEGSGITSRSSRRSGDL